MSVALKLAIENRRYEDLMRWKAGKLLTVPLRGMKFTTVQDLYDGTHTTKPEIAQQVELDKTVFVDEEGFLICYPKSPYQNTIKGTLPWEDYRYYWPIPKEELVMNPKFDPERWLGKIDKIHPNHSINNQKKVVLIFESNLNNFLRPECQSFRHPGLEV